MVTLIYLPLALLGHSYDTFDKFIPYSKYFQIGRSNSTSFSLFLSPNINQSMFYIKMVCQWVHLNPGFLVLDLTTLPTVPQPVPHILSF